MVDDQSLRVSSRKQNTCKMALHGLCDTIRQVGLNATRNA